MLVQSFRDFDLTSVNKEFNIVVGGDITGQLLWNDATQGQWDEETWASTGSGVPLDIERTAPLGNARAIALRIKGPTPSDIPLGFPSRDWSIGSLSFKYKTRKLRS